MTEPFRDVWSSQLPGPGTPVSGSFPVDVRHGGKRYGGTTQAYERMNGP
ncbi:hypothetical protein [Streptomyces bluensis]|nr:hypothetical protein [Streptomyces bluensis]